MQRLTKEQLEAVEVCQGTYQGTCEGCPNFNEIEDKNDVDCFKDPARTSLLLISEAEQLKEELWMLKNKDIYPVE